MANALGTGIADMRSKAGRLVAGAIIATIVLEMMMSVGAPKMLGISPMNPADLLTSILGLEQGHSLGKVLHFGIALIAFPVGYMVVAFRLFPGPPIVKGALWGILLWLAAMVIILPLAGQPMFFGFGKPMIAALVAHVVYGMILAAIVGKPD